jgi:hypothetical protein
MNNNNNNDLMEPSPPLEANSCSAAQDIPNNLRNPKVHSLVDKSQPLVRILSQISPVHTLPILST